MKTLRYLLSIFMISITLILKNTIVFALMPSPTYDTTYVVLSRIMNIASIIIIVIYILLSIIYWLKSKNVNKQKRKNLILYLLISIILVVSLRVGAKIVYDKGYTYTSVPKGTHHVKGGSGSMYE